MFFLDIAIQYVFIVFEMLPSLMEQYLVQMNAMKIKKQLRAF